MTGDSWCVLGMWPLSGNRLRHILHQCVDEPVDVVARGLDIGLAAVLAQRLARHRPDAHQARALGQRAAASDSKKKRTVEEEVNVT